MGQAKNRGSFSDRAAKAKERDRLLGLEHEKRLKDIEDEKKAKFESMSKEEKLEYVKKCALTSQLEPWMNYGGLMRDQLGSLLNPYNELPRCIRKHR